MRKRWRAFGAFLILGALWLSSVGNAAFAGTDRVETLAAAYAARDADRQAAIRLRGELVREAGPGEAAALWQALTADAALEPREGAAKALALAAKLLPEGDPARWMDVSGFLDDPMLSKPLMALDAVFYGAKALASLPDAGAAQLAQDMLKALATSPKARAVAFITPPRGTKELLDALDAKSALPAFGGWGRVGEPGVGVLPLARPVRGCIGLDAARSEGMSFLDASGRPAAGGPYAWDRRHGKILRVVDRRGFGLFWWLGD